MVPGSPEKKTGRGIGGVPARELTGGELEVAREHEEVKARRLVVLVRAGFGDSSPATVLRRWNGGLEGSGSCVTLGWC